MLWDLRNPNRAQPTVCQVLNPIWWLGDTERDRSVSAFRWFFRNPCCNFLSVIWGVSDCYRTVHYYRSPWTFAERGWNYGYTVIHGGTMNLPFVSWRGKRWEGMIGWKTSGALGFSLRRANAKQLGES